MAANPPATYDSGTQTIGVALGTTGSTAAAGNDSRLSDSRAPTGAAGGVLSGTYPNPGFAADMATQAELDAEAAARATADALLIPLTQRAAANGVATLDSGSKIPSAQLPALAINDTFVVVSQAAMLALTAQRGDIAVRSDLSRAYILTVDDPTTLANWQELSTPADAVLSVDGLTGTVSLPSDGASGTGTKRTLGTGAAQAAAGNHAHSGSYVASQITQNAQTGTTYTLVLTDEQKLVEYSNAGAITVTVPTDASVPYPVGAQVHGVQTGAGQVTVVGDTGVTVNATPGLKARAQWSAFTLVKRATNTWLLIGDLAA